MRRCSDYETAIILAVGDHGRVTSDLTGQLKNLVSIQTAAEEACQRAVGYHGVKSANEALIKAEVTWEGEVVMQGILHLVPGWVHA